MIATDADALVCDLAETYGVFDYKALPVSLLATLSVGLRDDSRIKMRLAGVTCGQTTMLLASALDRLNFLAWSKTKDAQKNANRPRSVLGILMDGDHKSESPVELFETGADFDKARAELLERMMQNGN